MAQGPKQQQRQGNVHGDTDGGIDDRRARVLAREISRREDLDERETDQNNKNSRENPIKKN